MLGEGMADESTCDDMNYGSDLEVVSTKIMMASVSTMAKQIEWSLDRGRLNDTAGTGVVNDMCALGLSWGLITRAWLEMEIG